MTHQPPLELLKLPIGISDFKEIIDTGCTFVDKSLFIKDLIDDASKVVLITRPRRFGKTLNLSMVENFFGIFGEDRSDLFRNLKISNQGETYLSHQGQYPVVYLSLKSVKEKSFVSAYKKIAFLVGQLYRHYRFLLNDPDFSTEDQKIYRSILDEKATVTHLGASVKLLLGYLNHHYGQKIVLLIDEYDTPINAAYVEGYYKELIDFMRDFLGEPLKDNDTLHKGILTGILRVAKESIFSGLNNFEAYTMLSPRYADYFGFTESEATDLLEKYGLSSQSSEIKLWYNGYQVGHITLYNPWSFLNCLKQQGLLKPYWVNTSDNSLIGELLKQAPISIKSDFELLLQEQSLERTIDEHIVFADLKKNENALWSFLLLSGYLKVLAVKWIRGKPLCKLALPNFEVKYLYEELIAEWFSNFDLSGKNVLINSLITGELEIFEEELKNYLEETFSYFDVCGRNAEQVYHAFVLGLVVHLRHEYFIRSNREVSFGRYDVMLIPKDATRQGIILEFKSIKKESTGEQLNEAANAALEQIEKKGYATELRQNGVQDILKLGLAFAGKRLCVKQ